MRCDDDRPVHHLLRATATTSRDHLTRPPPRRRPPSRSFTRTALTSHPSIPHPRPHRRHRPGPSIDRPGRPRSSRSIDRSIEPFDRSTDRSIDRVHRSTDRVHPIPSHPIAQPYPSKYLEPMTVIGWRIHGVRHTSTTGTRPPPTPRACKSIALEGRDLACLHDS